MVVFGVEGGARETVDESRARELLSSAFSGDLDFAEITSFQLTGKAITPAAAAVAAEVVGLLGKNSASLRKILLPDIIASIPEKEALETLTILSEAVAKLECSIEVIDLSDNALGEKGIVAFQAALKAHRDTLKGIYFCNNGLSAEAAQRLSEIFLQDGSGSTELTTMHFHSNMMGSEGVKALAPLIEASKKLEDVRLTSLRAQSDGMETVCVALKQTCSLQALDLSDSSLSTEEARQALAAVLMQQERLLILKLRDAGLGDGGAHLVGLAAARTCNRLTELDLSANEMTAMGLKAFALCIQHNPKLLRLAVEENELQSSGAVELAAAISEDVHKDLKEILCGTNEIGNRGARSLVEKVARLPQLTKLDISDNEISESTIDDLKEILDEERLLADDNEAESDEDVGDEEDASEKEEEDTELAELAKCLQSKANI